MKEIERTLLGQAIAVTFLSILSFFGAATFDTEPPAPAPGDPVAKTIFVSAMIVLVSALVAWAVEELREKYGTKRDKCSKCGHEEER